MFKSKKNIVIGIILTFIISLIAVVVYAFYDSGKSEEMWAFRDELDKTFFPIRNEVESCIFLGTTEKNFTCNKDDIESRLKDSSLTLSKYDPKYSDTKKLKNKIIESITILEEAIETNDKISPNDKENFVKSSDELFNVQKKLNENKKEIHEILDKYYN
ncbi:hypothetical protein [Bacillus sp. RIT 809]|uniref:hypothetical protein n=1 Tax=Bacillus sp. RIT 809 TaxID=2803857 RepID=UPI0019505EB1|nr:hypothetical protein [Bacillus sp. RIT 809]MBM6649647.1 hypothetical protein [Bacillus sp. RIT 809]